jgi:spoIIIJ-associated protein
MTIQHFISNLCKHSGVAEEDIQVEVVEDEALNQTVVNVSLPEDESGLFIGHHGETLSAIQRLARLIFQDQLGDKRLFVNVNQYREQRAEKLKSRALMAAEKVLATGREYVFEGLSSAERFVIHTAIGENPDFAQLETISEGEGRGRVLVLRLKA